MSIVLEGNIIDTIEDHGKEETNSLNWTGLWKFTKDKKSFLSYSYNFKGNEIPDDLYKYVSFINETGLDNTVIPTVTKYKKKKKKKQDKNLLKVVTNSRGRGRPRSNSCIDATKLNEQPNNELIIQEDSSTGEINIEESYITKDNTNQHQENNEHDDNDEEDDDDEGEEFKKSSVINTLMPYEEEPLLKEDPSSDDIILNVDDVSNTATDVSNTNILIDNTKHPLLGLWVGHFKVKVASGEESIEEVFFFYTMQRTGSNNNNTTTSELKQHNLPVELQYLPPDPQFPYAVILLQSSTTQCLSTTVNTLSLSATKEIEGNTTKEGCNDTVTHINHPITNLEVIDDSLEAINNNDHNQDDSNKLSLESKILPPDSILLLGFGKNCFGRFSIAGIYNEKTRSLSCEKRYMVSKYPSKRGRRSYAESSAIAIAGNINRKVTSSKPHKQHPASAMMMINNNDDALMYEDTLISRRDAAAVGKRKRISFSTQQSTGVTSSQITGTTKIKHKGDDTKHRNSNVINNKPNKLDLLQAQIAAAHAMVVTIAGNNALIGIRDPDNDDLNTFYREAFQDCDTGDIYEGGWAYGTRYGKGICVYNDGLMFEGNWVLNKEHGRGQLMTGDRQVIYSGDWLDGFMHGYGTYNFSNGDQYFGDWREGNRHGRGDYTFVNGCRYTGEWKDNKRSGKGIFIWPDKSYYNGDWEQDQRHGRGRLELANGFSYEGIWVRNIIEGKGTSHFPGGQEYEGTYKLGLREGRGTVKFAEGAIYEGRFREDRFDGQGTLKVHQVVPGAASDELMIPIQVQADFWRIHLRAGFGNDTH